jgi:hypothetical protein
MTILVLAQTSSVIARTHESKHGTKDITISVSWDLGSLKSTQKRHGPVPMQENSKLPQINKLQWSETVKFNSAPIFFDTIFFCLSG